MRRLVTLRATVVMVAGLVGVGLAGAASAQDLGLIYAAVIDQTGQPVTDLTPEEFQVTEDGIVAEVVSAQVGSEPMKIALLVDNGRRISVGQAINPLRDAVTGFIGSIPTEHEIGLYTIGGQIVRRIDFTSDRARLLAEAEEIHAQVDSVRFIDGIRETWDRRFDGDEAWPVFVVILTDALEASAFMNEQRYMGFVDMLRSAGVTVHTVQWNSRGAGGTRAQVATGFAINLAENTGGRYTAIAAATAFGDTLRQLATDMTAHYDQASIRYRVIYERPDPPGQSVSVSVTRPGVNLQLFGDRRMP